MFKSMLHVITLALLVLAVGCASTGDQNYMGPVDPNEDIHSVDRPGEVRAAPAEAVVLADMEAVETVAATSEDLPSLEGTDRSNWGTITVSPADGTVSHGRLFFHDCPSDHGVMTVDPDAPIVDRIAASLDRGYAVGWDATNARDAIVQPAKFALDLVLVPWHVFVSEEGDDGTTP